MNSKQFNILYWLKTTNIFIAIKNILDTISWKKRNYCMHSPQFIKEGCIFQHNIKDSIWVESGTYLGNTTRFLGSFAKHVYSIEPQMNLFEYATWRFNSKKNISILHGLSENILPNLIKNISGDICFWLDGHYSEGITFKGPLECPVIEELKAIEDNLHRLRSVCILVDDVRCFYSDKEIGYPPLNYLVSWANKNNLTWHIENDIFIAKTSPSKK